MKKALILGGGGSRGSYQAGFTKAMLELDLKFDIVTGTSIGALNGCLIAQNDALPLIDLWENMEVSKIIKGDLPENFAIEEIMKSPNTAFNFLKKFKNHEVDNSPLIDLVKSYYHSQKLQNSDVDFACVAVEFPSMQPKYATKDDMKNFGNDYLIASASCFPAFPIHQFDEGSFIDGGYHDNLPIDYAIRMGATEFVIVDLNPDPVHPHYKDYPNMIYIHPRETVGSFLNFDKSQTQRNIRLGYHDTMKAFGKLSGHRYTFLPYINIELFSSYYNEVLLIESRTKLGEKMNNNESVFKAFKDYSHQSTLSIADLNYIAMDLILDLLAQDSSIIYDFETCAQLILDYFKEDLYEPLETSLVLKAELLVLRFMGQNKLDTLKLITNVIKYPNFYSAIELKYLDFDPLLHALASYILLLESTFQNDF